MCLTLKSNLTKVLFVTYAHIRSADLATQAISDPLFPHGQPAPISLWTNLSNGKPPLSVSRVRKRTFDAKTEVWLREGVVTHKGEFNTQNMAVEDPERG